MQTLEKPISSQEIAGGNGLHVELNENGVMSLCLWGITMDDDETIFEVQLTPEQVARIHNAENIDAWKIDPLVVRSFQ